MGNCDAIDGSVSAAILVPGSNELATVAITAHFASCLVIGLIIEVKPYEALKAFVAPILEAHAAATAAIDESRELEASVEENEWRIEELEEGQHAQYFRELEEGQRVRAA